MKKLIFGIVLSIGVLLPGAGDIIPNVDPIHVGTGVVENPPITINVDPIHVGFEPGDVVINVDPIHVG